MRLKMKNIYKYYGNIRATNNVDLTLAAGEILAVVGENGAGKSTLMNILYGLEQADRGEIYIEGNLVHIRSPKEALSHSIGMVQQQFKLFESMTIYENVVFGSEATNGILFDSKENYEKVKSFAQQFGMDLEFKAKIKDCSVGVRQQVEILKLLYQNTNILIFDEPSDVLHSVEIEELLQIMEVLASQGKSILFITHKLPEVLAVSDKVLVLRDGSAVGYMSTRETTQEQLVELILGSKVKPLCMDSPSGETPILEVKGLTLRNQEKGEVLKDISFQVNESELVGIAGLSGSGQLELVSCLTGLVRRFQGEVYLDKADISRKSVRTIRKAGLSHVPEDSFQWGCAKEGSLEDNMILGLEEHPLFAKHKWIKRWNVSKLTDENLNMYKVKFEDTNQKVRELSGGNVQKLVVSRELSHKSRLYLLCNPTRGLDLGSTTLIHGKIRELRLRSSGILLLSADVEELLLLCDRILVLVEGKIVQEFSRGQVTSLALSQVMLGGGVL